MQWHESKAPICSILDILLLSSFPRMCQARQRALYYSLSLFLSILLQVPMQERQEIWVSLGWEDPLEEEMATQSSIIAWKTPWTEEPGRLQSMGSQRVRHDWATFTFGCSQGTRVTTFSSVTTGHNQNPLESELLQVRSASTWSAGPLRHGIYGATIHRWWVLSAYCGSGTILNTLHYWCISKQPCKHYHYPLFYRWGGEKVKALKC